jgi:alkaline phosphatase D
MTNIKSILVLLVSVFGFFSNSASQSTKKTTITFGSCAQEYKAQPILGHIADVKPDYFIYLGDNIYGDTYDMNELKAKYKKLSQNSGNMG